MNHPKNTVYVLSPSDIVRIRELLSMFQSTMERVFERSEITLNADSDELMNDMEFYANSTLGLEVSGDF